MDIKVNLKSTYIVLIGLFMSTVSTLAQPVIINAEYFINEDPGFGLGIPITIPAGQTTVDLSFTANTDTLSSGYHFIYIRTQDALGVWSYLEGRSFYVTESTSITPVITPKIVALEYFINEDPGQGLATLIDVIPDDFTVDITDIAITDTLSAGYHIIGTRAKTEYGHWGWYERRSFYVTTTGSIVVPTVQKITDIEYYFDDDPGQGQATSLGPYSPSLTFDLNELIPTSLSSGYHTFNVRSKDENGHWGFVEQRPVYVISAGSTTSITDINKIEYFFDGDDPGVGQATSLPITPGQIVEMNTVDIPTSPSLIDGEHTISVRARNGNGWGLVEIDTFDVLDDCMLPIAAFTPSLACAGQTVTFVDNSTSIQPDATYRWYLNGDAIIDDTTVGDATFSYPFPGTYVVALAIRQGSICLDSITTTIDIQPLPVAVFSSSGTAVNQVTTFTASASNLPAGAMWEWDFNEDNIVDDNTANTSTYIYSSEGTFNPELTITDGLGCSVSITNPITISGTGSSAPPSVDFLADNSCVGSSISFIDISQNLPVGSTYSWDFDGDGVEDTAAAGSQNFAYSANGSYTAKLIIDLGGTTIEATRTIEIVDIPVADFSAADVCEGIITDFADLSTNTETAAVYMWDFDNDGVVDSNAKTGVAYNYTSAGSHIVSLTISNGFGCTNTAIKQVNVISLPTPDFDWDIVCTGETISFNDLSSGAETSATYSWDLNGDGTEDFATAGDISYTYASKGIYNPTLLITNPAGCAITISKPIEIFDRPEVAIDINAKCYGQSSEMIDLSQKISPSSIYSWDFNNNGIEDDNTVGSTSFTYPSYSSYLVTLNIDNGGGCSSSTEELVVFSDAATPDFSVNKLCEGEEVVFTNLSTDVNPAAIYSWDFNSDGDEDSAFPGSTAHTYASAGMHDATLTIDNGGNCLAFKTIPLDVTPPPAVDLGPDEILCEAGTVILDAGSGYSSYSWPDGSGDQTYAIDQIGEYTVRVQDAKGCFNTDTIAVKLLGPPVPSFEYQVKLSIEGITLELANTSHNYDSIVWDFNNGFFASDSIISVTYTDFSFFDVSTYKICLTAKNNCEEVQYCEDILVSPTQLLGSETDEVVIYPNPVHNELTVILNSQEARVALINLQGKIVWDKTSFTDVMNIPMDGMLQGVYILLVEENDRFMYKRIIKE